MPVETTQSLPDYRGTDQSLDVARTDPAVLLDVLSTKIRTIPGVRSTDSFTYLQLRKQTYAWGTR